MKKFFTLSLMAMVAVLAMAQFPTRIYLCGPAGPGWATEKWPMYTYVTEDGVTPTGMYEWVGDLNEGDLKFLHGSSWEPGYAPTVNGEALTVGEHTIIDRPTGSDPDDKFAVTAGRYKLEINLTGEAFVLTVSDGTGLADKDGSDQQFEVPVPEKVYPIGDGTSYGWNPSSADPIEKSEGADIFDGVVFLKNGDFKLMHQPDWGAQYGPMANGEVISGAGSYTLCKPSDDNKWKIEGIDDLTAFHMIANVTEGTLVLRDTTVVIPALAQLYALGDAVGGWSFDDNAVELLPEEGVDSVYYAKNVTFVMGELKFFEKKDFGSQAWGATEADLPITSADTYQLVKLGGDDNKFMFFSGATYDITVDIKNGTMVLTEAEPEGFERVENAEKAEKVIINGQLYIKKGTRTYSVLGME